VKRFRRADPSCWEDNFTQDLEYRQFLPSAILPHADICLVCAHHNHAPTLLNKGLRHQWHMLC